MAGVALKIESEGIDEISKKLRQIANRLDDMTPLMETIGETIRASIMLNFEKEGRPKKWAKHSALTKERRGANAKILRDQGYAGGLVSSVNVDAGKKSVAIGTNRVYAAVHQFGAKAGSFGTVQAQVKAHVRKLKGGGTSQVKAHTRTMRLPWGDIPARPFLMIQDKDVLKIGKLIEKYIIEK